MLFFTKRHFQRKAENECQNLYFFMNSLQLDEYIDKPVFLNNVFPVKIVKKNTLRKNVCLN